MSTILKNIWTDKQVSRVELVESTGLTSGTITNLTQELIQMKVIREFHSVSGTVGRKRIMLGFDPRHYRVIGLDIGRSSFELVLMDLAGKILKSIGEDMNEVKGPDGYLNKIGPYLDIFKKEMMEENLKILGLGVGVPGPMDYEKGALINPPNFQGWSSYPLKDVLQKRFELPVIIEDDARTSAIAESWYGLGKNGEDLVFVTMGIGIGGGVISKGRIVRGTNGLYSQVGHMTLEPDGKMCDCGNKGCWETVGSITGILQRWNGGTMEELEKAAAAGDLLAQKCVEDTLGYLEHALVNICNMYDPELIVLGGRLFPYLSKYMPVVRERLRTRLYAFAKDRILLKPSTFGSSQSAVGATALVLESLLDRPLEMLSNQNLSADV
jgi:predicted NBD/HSP70 family sugar kinase